MICSQNTIDIPLPQFSLKILKKNLLKASFTWLVYISLYFLPYLFFAEISSTCNSPSVSKRLGSGTHLRNRNQQNSQNKHFFHIKWFCRYKIQIQIFSCQVSPGLAQPGNRAASTTEIPVVSDNSSSNFQWKLSNISGKC